MDNQADTYKKPRKPLKSALSSKAFKRYLSVSMAAIIVILVFVGFIYISGGRRSGIPDDIDFIQLEAPGDNQPVVVFETSLGELKAVLYPDDAPEYCRYFTSLVESGYYDGTYFCAVVDSAYSLGGTKHPDPSQAETEDSDLTSLEAEISDRLWPIRGALASYTGSKGFGPFAKNYAGSTFIMINDIDDAYMNEDALKRSYGDQLGGVFAENGGIPNFLRKYTIFAQIYDGWEVFETLMSQEVLESSQPASDIIIERAYITTYGETVITAAE